MTATSGDPWADGNAQAFVVDDLVKIVRAVDLTSDDEIGAEPLVGDDDENLIAVGTDVMLYGVGGAGKTTLALDLAVHLAAGRAWLGLPIAAPVRMLVIENEGSAPLFYRKVTRRLKAWSGERPTGLLVWAEPWGKVDVSDGVRQHQLAEAIRDHAADVVVLGPVSWSGMHGPGSLEEVRLFMGHLADVRRAAARPVVFVLIHHESKRPGSVSGAWEGACDTLIHVAGEGNGRTRMSIVKARHASALHGQTWHLGWTDGGGFVKVDAPDKPDDDLVADAIIDAVHAHVGAAGSELDKAVSLGTRAQRRSVLDRLVADGRVVAITTSGGVATILPAISKGIRARFYPPTDPAVNEAARAAAPDPIWSEQ